LAVFDLIHGFYAKERIPIDGLQTLEIEDLA